eukprot:725004-Pleurochrysis_carterae.AAC.1
MQQLVIEQCAVLIAVQDACPEYLSPWLGPRSLQGEEIHVVNHLPCPMAVLDGIEVPQLCLGCASWWTRACDVLGY